MSNGSTTCWQTVCVLLLTASLVLQVSAVVVPVDTAGLLEMTQHARHVSCASLDTVVCALCCVCVVCSGSSSLAYAVCAVKYLFLAISFSDQDWMSLHLP